ncbi:MAG: hypothetical protein HY823_03235 [Acidobacteria bacterium]|nr:hypothetical protein [Acidobacteriota bacterium]
MTIAIAWIRQLKDCEELIFVSDSRLSGDGRIFDACPKILMLPRTDCAISFAGFTGHAFPMMAQLGLAIDSYSPSRNRAVDIAPLKKHAIKIFNSMASFLRTSPRASAKQPEAPEADFIFGGYSWAQKCFRFWTLKYRDSEQSFVAAPPEWVRFSPQAKRIVLSKSERLSRSAKMGLVAFAGDQAPLARKLLLEKLNTKDNFRSLDMEPFEIVRDMLRDTTHSETIGGSPQIIKVYQFMSTAPLGIFWPDRTTGTVHIHGRPCLGYENIDRWVLDPDTCVSTNLVYSPDTEEITTPDLE